MKKSKLVMVGNGMAGVRTLEELLKIAPDLYDITVFGAEPHPNYNRILLSPVLAGEQTVNDIILNPLSWYAEHHIRLYLNRKVVQIDRQRLGFDFVKLSWNASELLDSESDHNKKLEAAIRQCGNNRVILTRCDNQKAVEFGQALGLSLFQGRYLDSIINPKSTIMN